MSLPSRQVPLNPHSGPSVEIVAHRGANREAPENTLAAFEKALALPADGIELDVQFTSDLVPVIHHDALVEGRQISDVSAAELRAIKPAMPSLEEVLGLVSARCRLYVEIKAAAATETVVRQLRPHRDWCAIHSFDHRVTLLVASLDASMRTGILLVSYLVDVVAAMQSANAKDVWQQADYIDRALVDRVRGAGGRVVAWTVNDRKRAQELIELGVDVICTDIPREILGVTGRTTA